MDPTFVFGERKFLNDLDWAGLRDVGWQVTSSPHTLDTAKQALSLIELNGHIGPAISTTIIGRINSARDVDFYRIQAAAGVRLTLTVGRSWEGESSIPTCVSSMPTALSWPMPIRVTTGRPTA